MLHSNWARNQVCYLKPRANRELRSENELARPTKFDDLISKPMILFGAPTLKNYLRILYCFSFILQKALKLF